MARIFYPKPLSHDRSTLWIADLSAAPTEIIIDTDLDGLFSDETALATTDYELRPVNAALEPEAQPYTHVWATSWGNENYWSGAPVRITGQWGWPSIPTSIVRATIQVTTLLRMEGPRATRQISELGDRIETSVEARGIVHQLISAYKKPVF